MDGENEVMCVSPNDKVGCTAVGTQEVNVSIPITVKAFGEVGNAETKCLGRAVVLPGTISSVNEGEACKFIISQKLKVEVPVIFGARAEAGEALINCGCFESEHECEAYDDEYAS